MPSSKITCMTRKIRWSFDDGIFDALCKWALRIQSLSFLQVEKIRQSTCKKMKQLFCDDCTFSADHIFLQSVAAIRVKAFADIKVPKNLLISKEQENFALKNYYYVREKNKNPCHVPGSKKSYPKCTTTSCFLSSKNLVGEKISPRFPPTNTFPAFSLPAKERNQRGQSWSRPQNFFSGGNIFMVLAFFSE